MKKVGREGEGENEREVGHMKDGSGRGGEITDSADEYKQAELE